MDLEEAEVEARVGVQGEVEVEYAWFFAED